MAFITLDRDKLQKNFNFLDGIFKEHGIEWAAVSKLMCGDRTFLKELIDLGIPELCDSRVSNLKAIKAIDPSVQTVYIKPPAKRAIKSVVQYADVSFNTEIDTIELISAEAKRQNKMHKVLIMIELGELREGVLREELIAFYERVFELPNIKVIGLGTNLTCMYGVLPSHDKLIQLSLYKQLIEAKFNREIPFVSGGSSVTIPLIFQGLLPDGINHFRVGETLFMGTDVYHNTTFEQMESDVFQLFAEIIELTEKPRVPQGEMGFNVSGEQKSFDDDTGETSHRAIIDMGLLDVDQEHVKLKDKHLKVVGASSDMIVLDLGENEDQYKIGDLIEFELDYMGILRIMNSRYIDKRVKEVVPQK
ncbi:alanine/ornithine racemase family PLP-dependent enzyme [bacterium]|nr:alanine/ornithine racemase family PLP-dependent enzyme [bacterium]